MEESRFVNPASQDLRYLYIKISFFLLWFTIHCPGLHQQQITLQRCAVIFLFLDHLCLIAKRNVIKAPFQVPTETCQLI